MREQRRLAAILAADVAGYSRMMGSDEVGTIRALKAHKRELIDPQIGAFRGRIVKTTGDGMLAEFASVVDAVAAAVAIQFGMVRRNETFPTDRRILFRMGVNLGDVLVDGEDIIGDGVNIASRLEAISEPGGICIAHCVHEQIYGKLAVSFNDLGKRTVKNIDRGIHTYGLGASDIAALPPDLLLHSGLAIGETPGDILHPFDITQQIRYCRSADGTKLAWSAIGGGLPLIKAGTWMTHLEKDLESPIWRQLWRDLTKNYHLVRYDARGIGLSDRIVNDISFDAFVQDLEAVTEATGIERFALLGISQGCAISVAYAAKYPERVSHLVLYGGFAQGYDHVPTSPAARERRAAILTLMRLGWNNDNPAYRQLFTNQFVPDATKEQTDWFNELERISMSSETAARFMEAINQFDVADLLSQVQAPTLVLHCGGDLLVPFEGGRRLAAGIPNARLVKLDSRNHLILPYEPAYAQFIREIEAFLRN